MSYRPKLDDYTNCLSCGVLISRDKAKRNEGKCRSSCKNTAAFAFYDKDGQMEKNQRQEHQLFSMLLAFTILHGKSAMESVVNRATAKIDSLEWHTITNSDDVPYKTNQLELEFELAR